MQCTRRTRRTWSDRWLDFAGTDAFFWGTGTVPLGLVVWMAWPLPLAWSGIELMMMLLLAGLLWPVFLFLVVWPVWIAVTVLLAVLDEVSAARHRRP